MPIEVIIRLLRDFAILFMLVRALLGASGDDTFASTIAFAIIAILCLAVRSPLLVPGGTPPRPHRFLMYTSLQLLSLCFSWIFWQGASDLMAHRSVNLQNLWNRAVESLPDAGTIFAYTLVWFLSAWWSAYVPVRVRSSLRKRSSPKRARFQQIRELADSEHLDARH